MIDTVKKMYKKLSLNVNKIKLKHSIFNNANLPSLSNPAKKANTNTFLLEQFYESNKTQKSQTDSKNLLKHPEFALKIRTKLEQLQAQNAEKIRAEPQ